MTSGGKVRIYELSRDLGLDNRDVLNAAEKLSIAAKSHSSSISDGEAAKIKALLNGNGKAAGGAKEDRTDEARELDDAWSGSALVLGAAEVGDRAARAAVALVAADGASIREPEARLAVGRVELVLDTTVRRDRAETDAR